MASGFDIGTDDFMKGNLQFKSEKGMEGGVVNSGELKQKKKDLSLYLLLMFVMKASFLPERDPLLLQEKWSSCRQTHPIN